MAFRVRTTDRKKRLTLIPLVKSGDPLTPPLWNRSIEAINQQAGVEPPREAESTVPEFGEEESELDPSTDPEPSGATNETWSFVSKQTANTTIEDPDDASYNVVVERTTSVTVRRPNGTTVKIPLE